MEFLASEWILFKTAHSHPDDLNAHKKYQVLFEKSPILQLIVRLEKKKTKTR